MDQAHQNRIGINIGEQHHEQEVHLEVPQEVSGTNEDVNTAAAVPLVGDEQEQAQPVEEMLPQPVQLANNYIALNDGPQTDSSKVTELSLAQEEGICLDHVPMDLEEQVESEALQQRDLDGLHDNMECVPMDLESDESTRATEVNEDVDTASAVPYVVVTQEQDQGQNQAHQMENVPPQPVELPINDMNNGEAPAQIDDYEARLLRATGMNPINSFHLGERFRQRRASTAGGNHFIVNGHVLESGFDHMGRIMLQTFQLLNRFDPFQRVTNGPLRTRARSVDSRRPSLPQIKEAQEESDSSE